MIILVKKSYAVLFCMNYVTIILHIRGMGYKHRDKDFRDLLKKVGAPRFCSTIEENQKKKRKQTIHTYICISCEQLYRRKRKMDVRKYCCSKCSGALHT